MSKILVVLLAYGLIDKSNIKKKFQINCFVHNDKNPSMSINLEKDCYYCFSCGAYGDALDVICEIEGVDKVKAGFIFRDMSSSSFISSGNFRKVDFKPDVSFAEGIRSAKFYYTKSNPVDWDLEKFDYMIKRGFTPEVLNKFGVRMTYNEKYKIVCPLTENGHFRGYVKRRTDGDDSNRKYLYNEGFKSAKTLHGRYFKPWVVITEGYMDWLKLQQGGFENSVALLKWKISDWQIRKLLKVTDRVISALDNTKTGEEGTEELKKHFTHVLRFPFPFGKKDCGELIESEMNVAKFILKNQIKTIDKL